MRDVHIGSAATIIGTALVAALCLPGCGGTAPATGDQGSTAPAATSQPTAKDDSTIATYGLTKVWVGTDADTTMYYFTNPDGQAGAFLVYHSADNTYERWVGAMETLAEGKVRITDDETGEAIDLTITPTGDDDITEITTAAGLTARLSPLAIDEVDNVLDTISTYASRVGEPAATPSTTELGGEFLIRINVGGTGLGQIAFVQDGRDLGWGGSASTHADAGETITLRAKTEHGSTFVKWTKDGADLSSDPEVEVSVDGDAEYVAVFA